jgi:PleD family two-component response regulator
VQCNGKSIPATASLGVTLSCNGKRNADAMVQACDQAMYASKRSGRNRVSVFDELAANLSEQAEVAVVK